MSTIHSSWVLLGRRSALICGTARFSTVRSIAYSRHGRASTARPVHSLRPARRVVSAANVSLPAQGSGWRPRRRPRCTVILRQPPVGRLSAGLNWAGCGRGTPLAVADRHPVPARERHVKNTGGPAAECSRRGPARSPSARGAKPRADTAGVGVSELIENAQRLTPRVAGGAMVAGGVVHVAEAAQRVGLGPAVAGFPVKHD